MTLRENLLDRTLAAGVRPGAGPPARPRQGPDDGQRPRGGSIDGHFSQPATLNFQGNVVAFARVDGALRLPGEVPAGLQTDIFYNVLALEVDSAGDDDDWAGWTRLDLPNEVRPSGMQLINVPARYNDADQLADLADAGEPFRVITNQRYIYLLRQTVGGTLLVNRLHLVRQVSESNPRVVEWVLQPAWEVRFQNSGKPDIPRNDRDVQSYRSPDRTPFVEPALELPIPGVTDGRFDAVVLPREDLLMCTVAVSRDDRVQLYELPLDEAGRFLLTGKDLDGDDRLLPDLSFRLQTSDERSFALSGRPALLFFLKQERVLRSSAGSSDAASPEAIDDGDRSFLVQRAGRVLLATAAATADAPPTLATLELALATDGTVARPGDPLTFEPVGVAPYALDFANRSHVTLPDIPLGGAFAFDLSVYPTSSTSPQLLVGNPDDATAPQLSLVQGTALELTFTDSDGDSLTATTAASVIPREAWSHIQADFDPDRAGDKVTFQVNGVVLPHRETGSGKAPAGPVTHLSAATAGLVGEVDSLTIYDAAAYSPDHVVGDWPLNTIVYADATGQQLEPPHTPNTHDADRPGLVYGSRLIPSTSPRATGNSGALTFDSRGLTVLASYFDDFDSYGQLASSPALLASADGLIHCYFQGHDNRLCVMQRDVEAARAAFRVEWSTGNTTPRAVVGADASQNGPLLFVAAQAGTFMNQATVTIDDPAGGPREWFCDVTLTSPSGRTETWSGVPRSLQPFVDTLNGKALTDPSDRRLLTGSATYYDASGTRTAAYQALPGNTNAALAGFVTRQVRGFPLATVEITAVSDELVDVTLTHDVPRWEGAQLIQSWPRLPARADDALRVLEGRSTSYPYGFAQDPPVNVPSYTIDARPGPGSANRVSFFTGPTVDSARCISVRDGSDANHCDVTIELILDGEATGATWHDVSRRQGSFARTIEGGAAPDEYDYSQLAEGDYEQIGRALVVVTDGNAAPVGNVDLGRPGGEGALEPDNDLRVYACLFEAFVTAPVTVGDKLPTTPGPVSATAFQRADVVIDGGPLKPVTGGSQLFGAHPPDVPGRGSVGLVGNTAGFTGDKAVLVRQGINGGWRNQPQQRTLTFDPGGYVEFPTDEAEAPGIGALTVQGDMSLELWCKPGRASRDAMQPNQRLVTFTRTPSPDIGGETVRYLAGLRDTPSLKADSDTRISSGYRTREGTLLGWFSPLATDGAVNQGTVLTLSPLGFIEPVISVAVGPEGHVRAAFVPDADADPIVDDRHVESGRWYQVALPWSVTQTYVQGQYRYDFEVELYVDGDVVGRREWRVTYERSQQWATMTVGDPDVQARETLPMLANEMAFLARRATASEIGRYSRQRIPANTPDLIWRWMLLEGDGDKAINSAPTGDGFSRNIEPHATWERYGLYQRPTFGHGEHVAELRDSPVLIGGWSHLAMVHQAGYALDLQGDDYGNCGHDPSTDLGDTFSLEAWIEPRPPGQIPPAMTVLAKGYDYSLLLDNDLHPVFSVAVEVAEETRTFTLRGGKPLELGEPAYLAATYELVTVETEEGEGAMRPRFEVHTTLWVNGQRSGWGVCGKDVCTSDDSYTQFDDSPVRVVSDADLNLGRNALDDGSSYFLGMLSDIRLWTRVLTATDVRSAWETRRLPGSRDGLVSWWRFNEIDGRLAFDAEGENDARLSRGDLRVGFPPTSADDFSVNGRPAGAHWLSGPLSVGGYPDADTFDLGRLKGQYQTVGMYGQLDTVRIWARQLTNEQIADSMNRPSSGTAKGLAGAWNFDDGSGPALEDATGRGNIGHRRGDPPPRWDTSDAPLSNEAGTVLNILGGLPTYYQAATTETPAIVEYADLQRDAYGDLISVLKRAYLYVESGAVHLRTGYKVGDLDTVYLGQAQSDPSVIGYIEGAPPVPSENQTMPHWTRGIFLQNMYGAASSVSFREADQVTYNFDATTDVGVDLSISAKRALAVEQKVDLSKGLGVEVGEGILTLNLDAGMKGTYERGAGSSDGINRSTGTGESRTTSLAPAGSWEPGDRPDDWVNPTVGRRYVPDNVGMALVKSRTVDVYASILASTRTTVKISYAPNPDIPVDVNILTFPIDPRYVKNGTLDGKVGLRNDPDYLDADLRRGSYFNPVQAYALKRRIERDQARLAAYYEQFNVSRTAAKLQGYVGPLLGAVVTPEAWDRYRADQEDNDAYDWAAHLAKHNIVNTYVWTAAGGTYAEETSTMNVYSESYGSLHSSSAQLGVSVSGGMTVLGFGVSNEFDAMAKLKTSMNVVRKRESSAGFGLTASVDPDAFLFAPDLSTDPISLAKEPTEGKVDTYRYMSFFLAPNTDNFDTLFDTVIDQEWLHNSMEAAAVALREATSATSGAWRILHRVTFVSRIPPRFQPVPDETRAPDIEPPANVEYNALLISLIQQAVGGNKPDPTPVEIGTAIATVLGTAEQPGTLVHLLPWWRQFLADTQDYQLPAAAILRTLREDLLQYMLEVYVTQEADRYA